MKSILSNLKKITVLGVLNNEDRIVEYDGEKIDLDELFEKYDGYDIKIELSRELAELDKQKEENK